MKTSRSGNFGSIVGKMMMGLALVVMIGSIGVTPSLAKNDHKQMGRHDNGRYENRGRGYDRYHHKQTKRYYRPYGYRERVYAPPPVVYAPPPPPGLSIFFPPIFIPIR